MTSFESSQEFSVGLSEWEEGGSKDKTRSAMNW